MSKEIRAAFVTLTNSDKDTKNQRIYVSKERQCALFQLRFFRIQGYTLSNRKTLDWLSQGAHLQNNSLAKTDDIGDHAKKKSSEKLFKEKFSVVETEEEYSYPYITKKDLETSKFS